MDNYITGNTIKELREQKGLTQKQLADIIAVSDKTVSKWETGRGYPDISILGELSKALNANIVEVLTGNISKNRNVCGNVSRSKYYVCPVCGNVVVSMGEINASCCGITLPPLEAEETTEEHRIQVDQVDGGYYISISHSMSKDHYISYIAYATSDCLEIKKLYPEQNSETRFYRKGHGIILAYCNKHGLFSVRV